MSEFPQLELRSPNVAVIWLGDSENRFRTDYLKRLNGLLDTILNDDKYGDCTMLVTSGKGRFYSNGIDLNWLGTQDSQGQKEFVALVQHSLARFLEFPLVTVAAVNGHAFAAGGMLALAHDGRVMSSKRGWLSMPEVFLQLPFRPGMLELLRCKVPLTAHRDFIVLGHRFTAERAKQAGLVDVVTSTSNCQELVQQGVEQGLQLQGGRDMMRDSLAMMKSDMYATASKALRNDDCLPDPRIAHLFAKL
eukprot:scpid83356/ scgid31662/ Fatty acid oxidation complex subunit alpha; Enoyl-CoA hydratase/3-hydroxybutyryl-CoA epimerase; 3-hydroxyacyl-CoA dehydrogenase